MKTLLNTNSLVGLFSVGFLAANMSGLTAAAETTQSHFDDFQASNRIREVNPQILDSRDANAPFSSISRISIPTLPNKTSSSNEITPARGMVMNEKGQIVLTGYPTPNAAQRPANRLINCNDFNKY